MRKSLVLIFFMTLASGALASGPDSVNVSARQLKVDSLIHHAVSFLGTNYCRGGVNQRCFDCSGFVQSIFASYGYTLPHSSAAMSKLGREVKRKQDLIPGDLIFFKGRNVRSRAVGHVGIVVQNDGQSIIFIHASVNKGICLEELEVSAYYTARYLTGRRIIDGA